MITEFISPRLLGINDLPSQEKSRIITALDTGIDQPVLIQTRDDAFHAGFFGTLTVGLGVVTLVEPNAVTPLMSALTGYMAYSSVRDLLTLRHKTHQILAH